MKFMGMIEYYHKFIEYYNKFIDNFLVHCVHMRKLLKKGSEFTWTDQCEQEFNMLKKYLNSAPSLKSLHQSKVSYVTTDANVKGLGAVLQQHSGGELVTIMFASRGLKPAETLYSVIEREALAVFWAIKKFKNSVGNEAFNENRSQTLM